MTWTRFDDQWDTSEKLLRAADALDSDAPHTMWSRAVTYCNAKLTDGRIHGATLRTLVRYKKPQKVIDELVKVGALIARGDDEYEMHDFLDWNDSKEVVTERRNKKQTSGSKGGKRSGEARQAKEPQSDMPPDPNQTRSKVEAPASDSLQVSEAFGSEKKNPSPSPSPLPLQEEILISEKSLPPLQPETVRAPGASGGDSLGPSDDSFESLSAHETAILRALTSSAKLKSLANPAFARQAARFTRDRTAMPLDSLLDAVIARLKVIDEAVADREAGNETINSLAAFVMQRLKGGQTQPGGGHGRHPANSRGGLQPFIEPGTWKPHGGPL